MMTRFIAPAQVRTAGDLLQAASALAMQNTLEKLRSQYSGSKRWLFLMHPYGDVLSALSKTSTIDGEKLAEYIAASIPLHVADGWVFLARAFDSVKSGDMNTAVHLAYYAELRAAMSLLASEGIGVFNNLHVAIGQTFLPTIWKGTTTHNATWNLLESWSDASSRVTTLLTALEVESRTISEWFDEARILQSVQHIVARQWLKSWSIDLKYFPHDRNLRNHTSYRPSGITLSTVRSIDTATEVVDPLLLTWSALEPSSDAGGAAIDRILLFHALSLAQDRSNISIQAWENFVGRLTGIASSSLETQLRDPTMNEHHILEWADNSSIPPLTQAVLARATLLLRIASGVCAKRLTDAKVKKQELQFWWSRVGTDGGLWPDDAEPDSFADLWGEVNFALDDVEEELGTNLVSKSMSELSPLLGRNIALTQFSRVPLWLLGVD